MTCTRRSGVQYEGLSTRLCIRSISVHAVRGGRARTGAKNGERAWRRGEDALGGGHATLTKLRAHLDLSLSLSLFPLPVPVVHFSLLACFCPVRPPPFFLSSSLPLFRFFSFSANPGGICAGSHHVRTATSRTRLPQTSGGGGGVRELELASGARGVLKEMKLWLRSPAERCAPHRALLFFLGGGVAGLAWRVLREGERDFRDARVPKGNGVGFWWCEHRRNFDLFF